MKIGLTFDLKKDWVLGEGEPLDLNAEWDKPETINAITAALESGGHQVKKIGSVHQLLEQLNDCTRPAVGGARGMKLFPNEKRGELPWDIDIVFNICEGRGGRNRESQVPLLLEMYGIPFVGADALSLGLTLDKVAAKKSFIADGVPTAPFFVADSPEDADSWGNISFPMIVKTRWEGTSKGLSEKSRVNNMAELKQQIEFITQTYRQSALVEQFISGMEFTVPVLGNKPPQAMPVVQVSIDGSTSLGDKFYTFNRVSSTNLRYVCPAQISNELTKKLQEIAVKAYQSVDCRDFGRVDFRVDEKGNPYVLEINPLPTLDLSDAFNIFPQVIGSTYNEVINRVLGYAVQRYNGALSLKDQNLSLKT
ncbi:MAG: ATP-grasp domain-containing protein [Candidatus Omnitrophica bacterium]|nr:ATP-grasp domain-containing protein [Candidatus Omnitrophota bacterium]